MNKLNITAKKFSPKFLPYINDYSKRFNIYKGSAGSGKSFFIAQKLVLKALKEQRKVLVCRRYGSTIRNSVFALFKDVLKDFKLYEYCKVRESDFYIQLPNGSEFIFVGLDDETKLLSIQNISDVFVEEIWEVSKETIDQLSLRMRGKAKNQQIYGAFNPISAKHWLYDFCEGKTQPKSFFYSQSTFRDNPFLSADYIAALEDLYRTNPNKARIFCDGQWGADVEGLVYKNHKIMSFDINELLRDKNITVRCGLDIGFIDPTAIVVSLFDSKNRKIYIIKEYYKRGATLQEIAEAIKEMGIERQRIFCDSADPRAIDFMRRNGIRAEGAKKGQGSVRAGISYLQDMELICHESCHNVATELENYVYLKDKKTGQYQEDSYDHDFSHSLDALRYAYSDLYTAGSVKAMTLNLGI